MGNFQDILDLLRSMGLILGVVFYAAIVFWTYKDARKRIDDPILVATATAVSMLPIVGVLVYMLLRPSEYLADVRERELEIRMMERQLGRQERCPYCKSHIEGEYLSCPVCTTKLRQSCTGCDKPLDPRWAMCPFCETEVSGKGRPTPGPGDGQRATRPSRSDRTPTSSARDSRPSSQRRDESSSDKASASKVTTPVRERSSSKPSSSKPSGPKSSTPKPASSKPTAKKDADITTEPFGSGNDRPTSDTLI